MPNLKPTSKKCRVKDCNCKQYWQSTSETSSTCSNDEAPCSHDINRHDVCKECDCKKYKKLKGQVPQDGLPCKDCGHGIESHGLTKKEGLKAIPDYIDPNECFFLYWNKYRGWQPCGAFGCAHYVAHVAGIKHSGITCQRGFVVGNDKLVENLLEKNINDVVVGDIWFREGSGGAHGHSGWVSVINPIKITHLPVSATHKEPTETPHGEGSTSGGKFYGKPTRWLANLNRSDPTRKPEVHDLENKKGGCQIPDIKKKKYYSSKEEAMSDGFDPCAHCIPGESTK